MRVLVTGASGFIGRNLVEQLPFEVLAPRRAELDLLDLDSVRGYLRREKPDAVVHSATTPGHRNAQPVDLAARNLRMFFHLAENAGSFGRMIVLGSGAEYDQRFYQPKMPETYAGTHVPADETGLSKFVISRAVQAHPGWVHLRPFGVFGKYEDWEIRFISNALCKALFQKPITLRQDRRFDYLFIDDLCRIVAHFLEKPATHSDYNATPDEAVELSQVAELVREVAGVEVPVRIAQPGMGLEYSGANARLRREIPGLTFTPLREAVARLHAFYVEHRASIREDALLVDK